MTEPEQTKNDNVIAFVPNRGFVIPPEYVRAWGKGDHAQGVAAIKAFVKPLPGAALDVTVGPDGSVILPPWAVEHFTPDTLTIICMAHLARENGE